MARASSGGGTAAQARKPRRFGRGGDTGPYFEAGTHPTRPRGPRQGVARIRAVAPRVAAVRKPAPTGMRGVAGASFYKAAKPGSKTPKISVRIPRVDFNPGKAVGDAFSHFAPQDVLFRKISDRLKNPSGR